MNIYSTSTIQLYPSRLTITNPRAKSTCQALVQSVIDKAALAVKKEQYEKNFKAVKNSFILSKASKKKIFDSINAMYSLSKPRTITMQNSKKLFNFQLSFITLTLPSDQQHSDTFLKSECLNQFLVEIRKNYDVKNYVWKAELQGNSNIHFHLILDKYIDYQALRRRWNRILEKHKYVSNYQVKMQSLSLSQYHKLRCKYKEVQFKDSAKAYAKGCSDNWRNPNSVDVRMVRSKKDLAVYMAKYICKDLSDTEPTEDELKRQLEFGRSWSRSYSLVKLKFQNKFIYSELKVLIKWFNEIPNVVKKCTGLFYEVYYFNAKTMHKSFKDWHSKIMFANAKLYNYPIPYLCANGSA